MALAWPGLHGARAHARRAPLWLLAFGVFVGIVGGLGHENRVVHWSSVAVFLVVPLVVCGLLLRHGLREREAPVDAGLASRLSRGGAALTGFVLLAYFAMATWMALRL